MSNEPRDRSARGPEPDLTWVDTFEEVLEKSIGAEDEVELGFDEFEVDVPLRMGGDAPRARWRVDGTVRVRVDGERRALAEWLRWWERRFVPRERRAERPE